MVRWKYFEEAEFIWNGDWEDPQLKYQGKLYNLYVIEDTVWERFNEFAEEENKIPTEENFYRYCLNNQEDIRELFEVE